MKTNLSDPLETAIMLIGEGGVPAFMVYAQSDMAGVNFKSIGYDEEGAFLLSDDDQVYRVAGLDPDVYDDVSSREDLRVHLFDDDGCVAEYDIEPIARQSQAMTFGV